jgi:hypothetical protein
MRWARHIAGMGKKCSTYNILVLKPEERRLVGRPRRVWVDNIQMDLREIGLGCCGLFIIVIEIPVYFASCSNTFSRMLW